MALVPWSRLHVYSLPKPVFVRHAYFNYGSHVNVPNLRLPSRVLRRLVSNRSSSEPQPARSSHGCTSFAEADHHSLSDQALTLPLPESREDVGRDLLFDPDNMALKQVRRFWFCTLSNY